MQNVKTKYFNRNCSCEENSALVFRFVIICPKKTLVIMNSEAPFFLSVYGLSVLYCILVPHSVFFAPCIFMFIINLLLTQIEGIVSVGVFLCPLY